MTRTAITAFLLSLNAAIVAGQQELSTDITRGGFPIDEFADVNDDTYNAIGNCCEAGCEAACNWLDDFDDNLVFRRKLQLGPGFGEADPNFQFVPPPPGPNADLDVVNANCCCRSGECGGDPHFKLWSGEYYDFHGQCELVLLDAPSFGEDLGLQVHIRTKIRAHQYSYIESAAIKIGDDILEVSSWGEYSLNGVEGGAMPAHLGPFSVSMHANPRAKKDSIFEIDLGKDQKIVFKTFKDFVSVSMKQMSEWDFKTSRGLMGDFETGAMLARDGKTVISDANQFGQEWQVRPEEGGLFQATISPQYPQKCIMPTVTEEERRRLGENKVSQKKADAACDNVNAAQKSMCAYDVMITGDLEMAEVYA